MVWLYASQTALLVAVLAVLGLLVGHVLGNIYT
jgi:hypothetical protein